MKSDNITVDTMLYSLASKRQKTSEDELPYGVQERLDNIESHLKLSGKVDQKANSCRLSLNNIIKTNTNFDVLAECSL